MAQLIQIRVSIPRHLHMLMREEASKRGLQISDIVRLAVSDRYRDRLFSADAAATSPAVRVAREAVDVEEVES